MSEAGLHRLWLRTFSALAVTLLLPSLAQAAGRVECSALESRVMARPVRYCVLLPAGYDTDKARRFFIVYYLHGLGDNEQSLINTGGWNRIEELQEKKRIGEFIVAAPEGGRSFYVNSSDGRVRYDDFFMKEFLPFIEKAYRVRAARASRSLMGISMGGYGALRFALAYPQTFGAVAVHMPALIEKLPAGITDARSLGARLGILSDVFGRPFNAAHWNRNSPFTLASQIAPAAAPRIYMDCGTSDEFGFDAGVRAMDKLLTSRKIAHVARLYPGNHGWEYVMQHLDASLEFLWGSQPRGIQTKK